MRQDVLIHSRPQNGKDAMKRFGQAIALLALFALVTDAQAGRRSRGSYGSYGSSGSWGSSGGSYGAPGRQVDVVAFASVGIVEVPGATVPADQVAEATVLTDRVALIIA